MNALRTEQLDATRPPQERNRRRNRFDCPKLPRGRVSYRSVALTHVVGGQRAENLLERHTIHFNLSDSESVTQASQQSSPRSEAIRAPPMFHGSAPLGTSSMYSPGDCFHVHTQLPDGRQSLLVDPGSVGNMCGDKWARNVARMAVRNGMKPNYEKREKTLESEWSWKWTPRVPLYC